jgi:phospholipase C
MKLFFACLTACFAFLGTASANPANFQHIVVIVQENRTPDNLFHTLCQTVTCSTAPTSTQYDIKTSNWLDNTAPGGVTQPSPVSLAIGWDPYHDHPQFLAECDANPTTHVCAMDGANGVTCGAQTTVCPSKMSFSYVENTAGTLNPYLLLARNYGWANYMFQTNQGPSFPAHQFLFGGSSAPSAQDDHIGLFADGNAEYGCAAPAKERVQLIDSNGVVNSTAVRFKFSSIVMRIGLD